MSEPRFEVVADQRPGSGRCRGCGQGILWALTIAQRPIPLDLWAPLRPGDGSRAYVRSEDTHWSTCSDRSQFARPKKAVPA